MPKAEMKKTNPPYEIAAFLGGLGYPDTICNDENVSFFRALGHYVACKNWKELTSDVALYGWFMKPPESSMSSVGLNRLALAMYHAREDLQSAFRLPMDKAAFQHWMRDGFFREKPPSGQWAFRVVPDERSVNLIGFHRRENGLANVSRSVNAALRDVLAVNIVDLDLGREDTATKAAPIYSGLSICCLPPSEIAKAVVILGNAFLSARRNICYLAWETEKISPCYEQLLGAFDEIWCYSGFVQQAVLDLLPEMTVRVVPLFVEPPTAVTRSREDFGLSRNDYVLGFHYDHKSSVHRKNPVGLVKAFRRAFPSSGRYRRMVLYIKIHNVERESPALGDLYQAAAGDERIRIVAEFWDRAKVYDWLSNLDLYVSLHRSEGFGYGMAEAMIRGVPTVATNYSGNLQFMNRENSLLVDYELVPIGPGEYSTGDDQVWANPCLDDAAEHLGSVVLDPDLGRRLASSGIETVSTSLSFERFRADILLNLGVAA